MILCIGTTPAAQRVMIFRKLELNAVNRARTTLDGVAGKSVNVAKVLGALGARPLAVGFAGGARGRELLEQMAARAIETDFVEVSTATRQCISVLDEATGEVTELVEESSSVAPSDYVALREKIVKRLPGCQAVVMSGSLTPGGPTEFYQDITALANARGILSVVDAQGAPLIRALAAKPGLVKPNRRELAETVGAKLTTEADVLAAINEIHARGAVRVVVTAGPEPTLASDTDHLWKITSPRISAVNPIGSGDAFTAGLVWQLTRKASLEEACRWAAAAGAANALSLMPGEVERKEVERLVGQVRVERL